MDKRVLVVDDESAIVEGVMMMLDFEQIAAGGAFGCEEALTRVEESFYPVILTDLHLYSKDEGLRLIDTIRERSPRTRIAVMTGYATPAVEEELLRRGVSVVLHKPVATQVILEAIQVLLQELESEAGEGEVDLEQLFVTLRKKLYDIPRRRFGLTHDQAEDVVQEAWILFMRKRELIRSVRPWLSGAVANLSRQQIDRRVRRRETADDDAIAVKPDPRGASLVDVVALRSALELVDARTRLLCTLIGMQGFSYEEVSAATGIPIGSIGPLYIRAKKKLRQVLSH